MHHAHLPDAAGIVTAYARFAITPNSVRLV
jgi:hypothetical protein